MSRPGSPKAAARGILAEKRLDSASRPCLLCSLTGLEEREGGEQYALVTGLRSPCQRWRQRGRQRSYADGRWRQKLQEVAIRRAAADPARSDYSSPAASREWPGNRRPQPALPRTAPYPALRTARVLPGPLLGNLVFHVWVYVASKGNRQVLATEATLLRQPRSNRR